MLDPSSTLLPHYQSHTPDFVLGNHLFPGFLPVPVSLSHGSDWLQLLECPISLLQMMSSVTNSGRDMLSNQPLQPREIAGKVHLVFWEGLLENIFEWKWRLEHLLLGRGRLPRRWELESCMGPPCWHWGVNMKNHWELRSDEERKLSGSWKNWCLDSASEDKTPRLFILWASVFLTQRNYSWGFLSLANKIIRSDRVQWTITKMLVLE